MCFFLYYLCIVLVISRNCDLVHCNSYSRYRKHQHRVSSIMKQTTLKSFISFLFSASFIGYFLGRTAFHPILFWTFAFCQIFLYFEMMSQLWTNQSFIVKTTSKKKNITQDRHSNIRLKVLFWVIACVVYFVPTIVECCLLYW